MAPSRFASSWRSGSAAAVLLLATLALAGGLALQAARAARSHRATAEGMLRDYAAVAAWEYVRLSRLWLSFGMSQAGTVILREIPPPPGALPHPNLLRRVLAEKECDCVSAGFARTVFRVDLTPSPEVIADGEPLTEATRLALLAALRADTLPASGPRRWRMLPPGEPGLARPDDVVLLWLVPAGDNPAARVPPRAAYGMVVEPYQITRPLEGAAGDAELLPPSLTGAFPADSLVKILVVGANGAVLYPSRGVSGAAPGFVATDTLGWEYGGLAVQASILAEAAPGLIIGGLPGSRVPQIAALLALTLAVGLAALVLLRREQQLARLRDDFVSGVSHELRTPLTQVRVLSELLAGDGFRSDAEARRAKEIIRREALRLTNLVENVLQFGRLRRRPAALPATPCALSEVIAEAREVFGPLLAERRATLEVIDGDGVVVRADRDALVQVLRNLLENALKYGPVGQTVRVRVESAGRAARLAVEDQGPGIPLRDRTRVWQPYQRLARDRNAPAGGSGLGLAVVAELMALLDGRAWVEDAPAGGARFVVELPLAGGPGAAEPPA